MSASPSMFLGIAQISNLSLVAQGCATISTGFHLEQEIRYSNHCVEMTAEFTDREGEFLFDESNWKRHPGPITSTLLPADSVQIDSSELGDSAYAANVLRIKNASTTPAILAAVLRDLSDQVDVQELCIHGTTHSTGGRPCPCEDVGRVDLHVERSLGMFFPTH